MNNDKIENKIVSIISRTVTNFKNIQFFSYYKLSTRKQTFFAKKLSFLIKSGITVIESITLIKNQTKTKSEIKTFERIIADVRNGKSLASSLERCRGTFGNFAINIIKAGELSGNLTQNLNYLADELRKKEVLRKKIVSSLIYPIIVTIATLGITFFLTMFIFPKIIPIFQSINIKLPFTTKMIICLVEIVKNYGLYIFIGLFIFIIGLILIIKNIPKVTYLYDGFIFKIPIFGKIAMNYNLTNLTRTLGILLKSGLSIVEALKITADTTDNLLYKKSIKETIKNVTKGKNISENINLYPKLYPEMLSHMIVVGERTGNLSNTLIYLSEFYENEFDDQTKNLSSTIEPVLMIMMGIMVGFIAISVITPIYGITSALHK
jgi:type IV pilus assembly protein PilC